MCYMIVISTTSDADLAIYNSRFVDFSRNLPDVNAASLLKFEHKWFLGSKDGCSCGFRHLESRNVELGFSEPADWMPEDGEDIAATLEVFGVLESIVSAGARLDCVDTWMSDEKSDSMQYDDLDVNLATLAPSSFRFFGQHRFTITSA